MPQPRTHVLALIDSSTSMLGVAGGVRAGVNAYLADMTDDPVREYRISMATFSDSYRQVCTDEPAAHAPRLDDGNYRPGGQTALYDGLCEGLQGFLKTLGGDLDEGDTARLVLGTDGTDNASSLYTGEQVMAMLRELRAGGWELLHLSTKLQLGTASTAIGGRDLLDVLQAGLVRDDTP